jgi:hypothetical protein
MAGPLVIEHTRHACVDVHYHARFRLDVLRSATTNRDAGDFSRRLGEPRARRSGCAQARHRVSIRHRAPRARVEVVKRIDEKSTEIDGGDLSFVAPGPDRIARR